MILMEHLMELQNHALRNLFMGLIGLIMVITGVFAKGDTQQTLWGLFGGLLFWTGWIEFIYVYYAHRFRVQPHSRRRSGNKPEYDHALFFRILDYVHVTLLIQYKKADAIFSIICNGYFSRNSKVQVEMRPMTRHTSLVTFMELNLIFMDQLHGIAILL